MKISDSATAMRLIKMGWQVMVLMVGFLPIWLIWFHGVVFRSLRPHRVGAFKQPENWRQQQARAPAEGRRFERRLLLVASQPDSDSK